MKAISSAIIVIAGVLGIHAAVTALNPRFTDILLLPSLGLALVGFVSWVIAMNKKD
jgi:hypothetical protein